MYGLLSIRATDMMLSQYTASVFLDRHGTYAKQIEELATVRLFTGSGCDHDDISAAEFNALSGADQKAIKLLPGRPECI